jgi:isopenicillin N synthase-like dioxygenase
MLRRWTNDRFLSTVHRVRNASGTDRYAIPFVYDPRVDTVIECLPGCRAAGEEPRHDPIVYRDYLRSFMGRSYRAVRQVPGPDGQDRPDTGRRGREAR